LGAGERLAIPTGFAMAVPAGYEAQIRPRSGLALKHGVTVANGPGTIDSDYRGEVAVLLVNLGDQDFTIARGMRIAQMVVAPVTQVTPIATDSLADTERGDAGFGSTGYQ
ncbi:MAG: dUTP diphosphatase, partial [Candidatus Puniceispirillum sp.]